eukprot:gb/GFBE01029003.1/.p1 GENE.gb/GFBE01029003.1/~~gb/GFBE01029003.1/.p1  ORF type:complete len:1065 (+),score=298.44 gb/GFBE01029003.1/:1-3195(+)
MPPPHLLDDGANNGSRGWHDRRWADGEVPDKIRKIAGWKRAMKTFMSNDPKLNDLVAMFTQKFVQLGQQKNFTISTLMDLAWTVLILTWEAVITEKLPVLDEVERGFKEKYEDLKEVMMEQRRTYLEEITEHRDRVRSETLSAPLQTALAEIAGDGEDHSIYRLQPEISLDKKTQEYFKLAMIENLKIAISKGASAAGETVKQLMAQLAEAQAEIERLKAELEEALLQVKLAQGATVVKEKPVRRDSRPAVVDDVEAKRLQAELDALRNQLQELKDENERFRQILVALGIDPNSSLDDIRKMLRDRENAGKKDGDEDAKNKERLKREQEQAAKISELEKKIAALEKQLAELRNKPTPDTGKATKELNAKIKELQEEVDRLKKALADAQNAKPDSSKLEELQKKNAELEKQIEMLKKQLNAKGDSGMKDLLKRNEELEKELARVNSKVDLLNKELAASKRAEETARQGKEEAEGKLKDAEKEIARLRAELEDALDALSNSLDAKQRERPKVEAPPPVTNNGDLDALRAELQAANLQISKLKKQLKESKEENEKLKQEVKELKEALEEAELMRKALEKAMEELKALFEDFKKKLQERGVDVSLLDEALAAAGMPLNPMSVFDRLYMDALRRHKRMQEKFYVDMRNAQQETWERILGIHHGSALSRDQLELLIADGTIDPRLLQGLLGGGGGASGLGDSIAPGSQCPHCGVSTRTPLFAQEPCPHERPPSPSSRHKFGKLRTGTASSEALEERPRGPHLALDVIGIQTVGESERKPFAVVTEPEQWRSHHNLQAGEVAPEFAMPSSRSRSPSPTSSTRPLSQTMPAQLLRRQKAEGSRASSPHGANTASLHQPPSASKPLNRSQTHPGLGVQSLFEFPSLGDARAARTPTMPVARTPGTRHFHSREVAIRLDLADEMQPQALPLQQKRPGVGPALGGISDGVDALGQTVPASEATEKLMKLGLAPEVDGPKFSYGQVLMPDVPLTPSIFSKAPGSLLPQISGASPLNRSGKSQTWSGVGDKLPGSQRHHHFTKSSTQASLHRATPPSSSRPDIVVMGVSQTRSPAGA